MTVSERPVALVTGSATGVGRACALRFAAAGYDVVINYTRSEQEAADTAAAAEEAGASALVVRCDVSDDDAVRSMIGQIGERFGRLDRLVNNAACTYFIEHSDLEELTGDKWDRILSVNVKGAFFVTRAAVPLLRDAKGASVVNISSVAGVSGLGSSIAYCASKGALNTMTKSLARTLAPEIRVNAVCPGPIDTRWLREWKSGDEIEEMTSDYPIPRAAVPDDVADVVMYLADGTELTTGQCLVVDGGRTI
ncbi:Enoyl-[acyl-carrier-protein] reductase [NADPH] FabL [Maioricimonas rarisocia]|uniref:Enoyl-[acyl-carrier-protein] reductase [NADPH] FabL n=1 Tax=Maioricimonas rarisocia TaxID=2528026 RepID=A0A517Z7N6_9PLAN|nr:SDR family oxidoreductase [Maioricimonas rarisocia]QDU38486.1 Enoyl-[acyl-carrier-protein] reductase [NADPH] FabL [Maioricimonas rarisocia]